MRCMSAPYEFQGRHVRAEDSPQSEPSSKGVRRPSSEGVQGVEGASGVACPSEVEGA